MTSILKTEDQLEQDKADARRQRDLWSKIQSSKNNDLAELRAHETQNHMKRDARGRIMGSTTGAVGDTTLNVFFEKRRVPNMVKTAEQGKPVYEEMDFITIIAPGHEKELTQHSRVDPFYEWRFGKEYEDWKAGIKSSLGGLALEEWTDMTDKEVIEEFKRHGIHTVEQLSTAGDQTAAFIAHFATWKNMAQKHLVEKAKSDEDRKVQEALARVRAEYDAQLAAQQKQIDALIEATRPKLIVDEKPAKKARDAE